MVLRTSIGSITAYNTNHDSSALFETTRMTGIAKGGSGTSSGRGATMKKQQNKVEQNIQVDDTSV